VVRDRWGALVAGSTAPTRVPRSQAATGAIQPELLGERRLRSGCCLDLTAQHVAFEPQNLLAQEITKRAVPGRRRDHFEPGGRPEGPEEVDEHVERSQACYRPAASQDRTEKRNDREDDRVVRSCMVVSDGVEHTAVGVLARLRGGEREVAQGPRHFAWFVPRRLLVLPPRNPVEFVQRRHSSSSLYRTRSPRCKIRQPSAAPTGSGRRSGRWRSCAGAAR